MKTISLSVSESDYEAFRQAAKRQERPIAQLIREAMAEYRVERLDIRTPLRDFPSFPGTRLVEGAELPARDEIYDEVADRALGPTAVQETE